MRIPFLSKSEQAAPLRRCIQAAAGEAGINEYQMALGMTGFLEQLADEVAREGIVRIPGFGVFGAWQIGTRSAKAKNPSVRHKVVFFPSRGFNQQIRWTARLRADAKEQLKRYRRNHGLGSDRTGDGRRVFTAMEAMRVDIRRQMAEQQVSESRLPLPPTHGDE